MSKFVLCKHKFLRNVGFDLGSSLFVRGAGPSFHTITHMKIMEKVIKSSTKTVLIFLRTEGVIYFDFFPYIDVSDQCVFTEA